MRLGRELSPEAGTPGGPAPVIDRLTRRFGVWLMVAMSTPRAVNTRAVRITAHTGHSAPLLAWQLWLLLLTP
jgi:hypothetical protein